MDIFLGKVCSIDWSFINKARKKRPERHYFSSGKIKRDKEIIETRNYFVEIHKLTYSHFIVSA